MASFRTGSFSFALMVMLAAAVPALAASPEPPANLRRLVEEAAVMVRLNNRAIQRVEQVGTGLVVGGDDEAIFVATAAHVVEAAVGRDDLSLEVKLLGRQAWVEVERVALGDAADGADLALLRVQRRDAPFEDGFRGPDVPVQDAPAAGLRVWALGTDRDSGRLQWTPCYVNRVDEKGLILDGRGVAPGYSGGIVVSATGLLSMVRSQGTAGAGHDSLGYRKLGGLLSDAGVETVLTRDAFLDALAHAASSRLTAAMFVIDFRHKPRPGGLPFWAGIEFTADDVGVPRGHLYTGDEPEALIEVEYRTGGGGLTVLLSGDPRWPSGYDNRLPALGALELQMSVDPRVQIKQFLIASVDLGDRQVFLAIPTGAREMAASRLICDRVPRAQSFTILPEDLRLSFADDLQVNRQIQPFVIPVSRQSTKIEIAPPPWLTRDEPLRITGRLFVSDAAMQDWGNAESIDFVAALPLRLLGSGQELGQMIGEGSLGRPGERIEFQVPTEHPRTMSLEADMSTAFHSRNDIDGLGIADLVIEYAALLPR